MKILSLSDLHIHNYKNFDDGNYSRLRNCLLVIDEAFKVAAAHDCDIIACSGDLFDQAILHPVVVDETIRIFAKCFDRFDIKFISVTGNHEQPHANKYLKPAPSAQAFLDTCFPNFKLLDNKRVIAKEEGIIFGGIPYYPEYAGSTEFEQAYEKLEDCDYLLIHQTPVTDQYVPYYQSVNPNDFPEIVLCGHIHNKQRLTDNFLIVGSPLHRDAGDIGHSKGFWIIDEDKFEFQKLEGFPEFKREKVGGHYFVPAIEITNPDGDLIEVEHWQPDLNYKPEQLVREYLESNNITDVELLKTGLSCLNK